MKVYFYVETSKLPSIQKYGLLSARKYYELFGKVDVKKYIDQYKLSIEKYTDLQTLVDKFKTIEDKILAYLDWRDERTLNGSKAIYFLFHPIPDDERVKKFIKTYRGNFLHNRTLLEYNLQDQWSLIGNKRIRNQLELWLSQPHIKTLWFDGIPHGYFVPRSGKIPWSKLKIVN